MENKTNRQLSVVSVNGHNEVVTTTEEHTKELINSYFERGRNGMLQFIEQCEILAELRMTKGYLTLGYTSFDGENSILSALMPENKDSKTEGKNMCLLATTFGTKQYDADGNSLDKWVISDENKAIMSHLSKGIIYELPALKECPETDANIVEVFKAIGFNIKVDNDTIVFDGDAPTVRAIREVKGIERQFKLPYDEAKVEKAKLDEQAAKVASDVEKRNAEANNEETTTEEPQTSTEEPQTTTEEPINKPQTTIVETDFKQDVKLDLKTAKTLLKEGDIITIKRGDEYYRIEVLAKSNK